MSKTIKVPEDLFAHLDRAAAAEGLTPRVWVDDKVPDELLKPGTGARPRTMAERLAGRLGRIGSETGCPSAAQASDSFAEYLLAKQRAGRL